MIGQTILRNVLFTQHRQIFKNLCSNFRRNVQVSIIGATNDVGTNLALLLKQNDKIEKLILYDDDVKVRGIEIELNHIPGGPVIESYARDTSLNAAIKDSHLIVMVYRIPRKPGCSREQMIASNAPAVQKLCRAMANENISAFLAIATNPVNSMVPFASNLLYKYGCYNPFKIFGITQIDIARARILTANAFGINPVDVSLPVIGGHSDDTIVPLFSNMQPAKTVVDPHKAATLTRLLRKAGTEVVYKKQGKDSATLAMATSVNEFVDMIVDAIKGDEVTVNCYTANPNFGTRFFAGPTQVGPYGIMRACHSFQYSDYETFLLNSCVPVLNRDVEQGEDYVRFIDMISRH